MPNFPNAVATDRLAVIRFMTPYSATEKMRVSSGNEINPATIVSALAIE